MTMRSSNATPISRGIMWVSLLIIALLVAVFFIFYNTPASAPSDDVEVGVLPENPPEFVNIQLLADGTRIVKNEKDEYQLKIEDGMYVYSDRIDGNALVIQDFLEPDEAYGGMPGCQVTIESSLAPLGNVEDTSQKSCSNRTDCNSYEVNQKKINSTNWYEVKYFGEYVGSGWPTYKTSINDSSYNFYFHCGDQDFIDAVLNHITF